MGHILHRMSSSCTCQSVFHQYTLSTRVAGGQNAPPEGTDWGFAIRHFGVIDCGRQGHRCEMHEDIRIDTT